MTHLVCCDGSKKVLSEKTSPRVFLTIGAASGEVGGEEGPAECTGLKPRAVFIFTFPVLLGYFNPTHRPQCLFIQIMRPGDAYSCKKK